MLLFFAGAVVAISAGAKMPAAGQTYPDTLGVFALRFVWFFAPMNRHRTKHE